MILTNPTRLPGLMVFLSFLHVCLIQCQDEGGFAKKGTIEFGGSASFQSVSPVSYGHTGSATTSLIIQPYVGYFFTDGFELGLNPFGFSTASHGSSSQTEVLILLAPAFNFHETGTVYPFIEGLLGYSAITANHETADGLTWGGRTGVKSELSRHVLINVSLQYLQVTTNPEGASERIGYNQFLFSGGLTAWF